MKDNQKIDHLVHLKAMNLEYLSMSECFNFPLQFGSNFQYHVFALKTGPRKMKYGVQVLLPRIQIDITNC